LSWAMLPMILLFITANIHATQIISWPDMMRFGKSFRSMLLGQVGLPVFYTTVATYGAIMAGISLALTKSVTYDPSLLVIKFVSPVIAVLMLTGFSYGLLMTNIFSNSVPPIYDLNNTFPSKLNWTRGVLIVTLLGIAMGVWSIYLKGAYAFFNTFVLIISGLLGPIAGIIVADYVFIHKFKLDVDDIFKRKGKYTYYHGVNLVAVVALVVPLLIVVAPPYLGITFPGSIYLYKASWISGFLIAFAIYLPLSRVFKIGK
ncbi:MAG: cytosine permease, partial [Thermoprotei archaeon]